jgi:RND family efflux transporter MFP subunit
MKAKMVFPKKVLILSFVIIVIGLLGYFLFLKKPSEGSSSQPYENLSPTEVQEKKPEETPLSVKVVPARRGELIVKLKSPGEAVTERKIVMQSEVAGVLKKLNVRESQHVREGEVLAELDDQEYRLNLEKIEALRLKYLSELFLERQFAGPEKELSRDSLEKINKARENLDQASYLFHKGLISREDFEKAKKDYELTLIDTGGKKEEIMASSKGLTQAEIDVKIAQIELEKTKIKAPFSGIITGIQVSPQEHIERGRDLFTLVNINQIKVQAKVLESEMGKMETGRKVDLKFSAYPQRVFKGRVEAISPVINSQDRTCTVDISVDNPEEKLKPGMHAEVEIAAEIYKDRLLVPQEAVLVRSGRKLVFVVEKGLAKWRYVEVGLESEDYAEVLDGVKEGDSVIVEGHFILGHDARVQIVN